LAAIIGIALRCSRPHPATRPPGLITQPPGRPASPGLTQPHPASRPSPGLTPSLTQPHGLPASPSLTPGLPPGLTSLTHSTRPPGLPALPSLARPPGLNPVPCLCTVCVCMVQVQVQVCFTSVCGQVPSMTHRRCHADCMFCLPCSHSSCWGVCTSHSIRSSAVRFRLWQPRSAEAATDLIGCPLPVWHLFSRYSAPLIGRH
jgi:hypothetical protein